MKLALRFILPLLFLLSLIAYVILPLVDSLTLQWFQKDLALRAKLIARTIESTIAQNRGSDKESIVNIFEEFAKDERLLAVGFCNSENILEVHSSRFPPRLLCKDKSETLQYLTEGPVHVMYYPVNSIESMKGDLVVVHDMSFVQKRSKLSQYYILLFFFSLTSVLILMTVVIAQLSWRDWMKGIRALIKSDGLFSLKSLKTSSEFTHIAKDLRLFVRELERERKIRDESQLSWAPFTLKEILQKELSGDEILILSNREPYIHTKKNGNIEVVIPASGLVTALEPIMRACSGTWIAHGSGNADKEVVDKNDHVRVPPDNPSYKIRRVWLSKEEENGYYYGFSNEGLWPLCHIAHTQPIFRTADWEMYKAVNEKFAKAVIEEAKTPNPVILIQDYHFALAPKLIREKLPNATIITFWHIPWPNAESFSICPWREEILQGLLGSSILGFHTRFHCNNFIEAADRFLECRIDRDSSLISYRRKITAIESYPISIEWAPETLKKIPPVYQCKSDIRMKNNISVGTMIGIGVDRLDYTKGIIERFRAVERLFELFPEYIGKFTFIQIAAPTRSAIKQYRYFEEEVKGIAREINAKYSSENYAPIILLAEHHGPMEVFEYFRASDLCFVSSLHDGMNLVAKEYISSKEDEQGVLILSQFTGASKELTEALVVNPYDIDQCARAIEVALSMPISEQKERMRSMRAHVQENNVFRWAGKMLIDAAKLRHRKRILERIQRSNLE